MTSWVHLFSKFSSEVLLFEALLLCAGIAAYSAWVILKKRREILAEEQIPGSVVKVYLSELISEAEQMRGQLYGLLKASGVSIEMPTGVAAPTVRVTTAPTTPTAAGATAGAPDPATLEKVLVLENKMREQTQAMELLVSEKTRIERELVAAKTSRPQAAAAPGAADNSAELKQRIQVLEAKLEEYSVIEDDLANLKRLQQENAQLRAQVGQPGAAAPAPAPSPAPAAAAAKPAPAPAPEAPAPAPAAIEPVAFPTLEPSLSAAPAEPAGEPAFAALAEQVEQSLPKAEAAPAAETPAASPAAPAAAAATAPASDDSKKNEADLLAEFEKMING
jgi:hypothetical protein